MEKMENIGCEMSKEPEFAATAEALAEVVKRLRAPGGCPWDREQTIASLSESLSGECAEVVEAIDLADRANLCEELGDLLMNVVFIAVVAEEEQAFDWTAVCRGVIDKMVRRHPHVFGHAKAENVDEVMSLWQAAKAAEKGSEKTPASIYAKPVVSLSALDRATAVQKKAARVGFDWTDEAGIMVKIEEETRELSEALASGDQEHIDEELGDLLFAAVNLARFRKRRSADELLRAACRKFVARFQFIEQELARRGRKPETCTIEELEACYQKAKKMQI